jgi:hypothetical protein
MQFSFLVASLSGFDNREMQALGKKLEIFLLQFFGAVCVEVIHCSSQVLARIHQ